MGKIDLKEFGNVEISDGKLTCNFEVSFDLIRKRFTQRWAALSIETQELIEQGVISNKSVGLGKREAEVTEFFNYVSEELLNHLMHMDSFYSGELNKYMERSQMSTGADFLQDHKKIQDLIDSISDTPLRLIWAEEIARKFDPQIAVELAPIKTKLSKELTENKFSDAIVSMQNALDIARNIFNKKLYIETVESLFTILDSKINPQLVESFSPQNEKNLAVWVDIIRAEERLIEKIKFEYLRDHKNEILTAVQAMIEAVIDNVRKKNKDFNRNEFEKLKRG
jgi:hypothetical protein